MTPPPVSPPPEGLRLRPLEARTHLPSLRGPEPRPDGDHDGSLAEVARGAAACSITGGGMVAVLDPAHGLAGLWRGREPLGGALGLTLDDVPLEGSASTLLGPGSWERAVPLPCGGRLVERGLLSDPEASLVLQWTLEEGRATGTAAEARRKGPWLLGLELAPGRPDPGYPDREAPAPIRLALEPGAPAPAVISLPGSPAGAARGPGPFLEARAVERRHRRLPPGEPFLLIRESIREGPSRARYLPAALAVLDEAPLGADPEGKPLAPFLAGIEPAGPRFLQGRELAETGLAAVLAGRRALAMSMLEALAGEGRTSADLPLLLLAGQWALWSGRPHELVPLEAALAAAVERGLEALRQADGSPDQVAALGAAFPSPARILELVADAMEPLGRPDWTSGLRERIEQAGAPALRAEGPGPRRALPVLGGSGGPVAGRGHRVAPVLPSPDHFGPPTLAGRSSRRTLDAARLVRSWIEGALGAEADAAFGRLTLGPRIPGNLAELSVRALHVGDARVGFDCRRKGARHSFVLRQESGRTPLNLIFEPQLPCSDVEEVLLGERAADVEVERVPGGVRIRCQFPLDSERRMTIVGTD